MNGARIALAAVSLLATMCEARPLSAQDARRRFENEARKAWRTYSELATHVQGTVVCEVIDRTHGQKLLQRGGGDIKVSGKSAIVTDDSFKDNEPITLEGCNEDYAFNLQRARDSQAWILTNLTFDPELVPGGSLRRPDLNARRFACAGLRCSTGWLPEMVDEAGFSVDRAETRHVADETLVDVTFRFVHRGDDDDYAAEGHMLLDPARYWLLREAELKVHEPPEAVGGAHAIHVEYKDSDGLPVPSRYVMQFDVQAPERAVEGGFGKEDIHKDIVWEYDFRRVVDANERDFTLSAYGLPEPIRPAAGGMLAGTRLLALVVIGAVLVVVGILLRRRLSGADVIADQ